jgi:hypothetical protein
MSPQHCSGRRPIVANSTNPDLIKVTEIFLIPSSFLVAALGAADTNLHRAAVSALGLTVSVLWRLCSREALADCDGQPADALAKSHAYRRRLLHFLSAVFVVGWVLSLIVHLSVWNRPLGS